MNSWQEKATDYFQKKGRLKLATGAMALEMMQERGEDQTRRLKAESQMWHKAMTGEPMPDEDDEMRQTILGDQITNVTSPVSEKRSKLGTLAAIAIGAMIPGAGIAGYLIADYLGAKTQPVVENVLDDTSVEIGLGRIEDYE